MNTEECALCYAQYCEEECEEDSECECKNHEHTVLLGIYDTNEDGAICPEEFESLFNDAVSGEIPWPEDDDEDDEYEEEDEEEKKDDEEEDVDPHVKQFNECDLDDDGVMDNDEIVLYYAQFCEETC